MVNELEIFKQLANDIQKEQEIEKNKSIDELLNVDDRYAWIYKMLFKKSNGYETIEDLLNIDEKLLDNKFTNGLVVSFAILSRCELLLKDYLRDKGLLFKFEYEKYGVSESEAAVKLNDLEHFPQDVLEILERKKVEKELRIVDLLNMKFEYLCKLLGNEKVVTLKNYLHQLGIKLTDEKVLFIEVSDTYDENTIFIKDVFDDVYTTNLLHKAEIFTLDDLIKYGEKVFELDGIGGKRKTNILYILDKYGVNFTKEDEDKEISLLKIENEKLRKKIFVYEQKVSEKEALMIERKYLLEREKELDKLITYKDSLDILNDDKYTK